MKINDLSELELHDEIILDIEMKSIKDYFDNICIRIEHCKQTILIKCSDCFSANLNCNMNIAGKDSVRNIEIADAIIEIPILS